MRESGIRAVIGAVVRTALCFALGAATGTVLTFIHRQYAPWGLIGALVIVALLLAGLRLVSATRTLAAAAAVGILAATAVLALPGAGGSVLLADGPLGYTWAIGPTMIAVVAIGWPRPRARPSAAS